MKPNQPSFSINLDPTNPGQFFACCGLLELADRLWPGAEGWFNSEGSKFFVSCDGTLRLILAAMRDIVLANSNPDSNASDDDEEREDDDDSFVPLEIVSPFELEVDWFRNTSLKPWAGSMDASKILTAMARSIDPSNNDPWSDTRVVCDPDRESIGSNGRSRIVKGKPREPFYFDSRRGENVIERDVGFTPDAVKKSLKVFTHTCPAVEAFALLGLQRCRPRPLSVPRVFEYSTWGHPLPVNVVAPMISGDAGDGNWITYRFENKFRTGQKKHKAFRTAVIVSTQGDSL